uniref:Uncharacterized protein n=1 Tax=Klebsiella pneumoniae TaxID=573 RepID=A0A8B0SU50_KLEPN|nr:hypothetical protein [Klebsiella pneumoniae]
MQPSHRVVTATAVEISSCVFLVQHALTIGKFSDSLIDLQGFRDLSHE